MNFKNSQKKGFTLLVSIIVTGMLLVISFAVVNIAYRQLVLSNFNEESQYAFYNADSGTECAVCWDFKNNTSYFATTSSSVINCNGQNFTVGGGGFGNATSTFTLNLTKGCAVVSVGKHNNITIIDSRGYNTCTAGALRRVERGEKLSY